MSITPELTRAVRQALQPHLYQHPTPERLAAIGEDLSTVLGGPVVATYDATARMLTVEHATVRVTVEAHHDDLTRV